MTEADFWSKLEFRVCRELRGMEEKAHRSLWCDGFLPERYLLDDPTPRITGHAWMGIGPRGQEKWEVTLSLEQPVRAREEIPWEALLPREEVTEWLEIDLEGRRLLMTPSRAAAVSLGRVVDEG